MSSERVNVIAKLKPLTDNEKKAGAAATALVRCNGESFSLLAESALRFSFNLNLGSEATQEDLFDFLANDLVTSAFTGVDYSVIAYG